MKRRWFGLLIGLVFAPAVLFAAAPSKTLHQYVFFNMDREQIESPAFLKTTALEGAQVKYTWRQLEHGPGGYDFSMIQSDLASLKKHGKRLFIQFQDASFEPGRNPVARYLLKDPQYHGGASKTWTDDEKSQEGWVSRRWDPAVQARFAALMQALGHAFDGKVEGITLPESAIGMGNSGRHYPPGFTPARYTACVEENMRAAKAAFPHSICLQYANFMPGEWFPDSDHGYLKGVYATARKEHLAVGGPDVLPDKPGQMANSYSLLHVTDPTDIVCMAVQEGNYDYAKRTAHGAPTIPRLLNFARDYLHANYIFWCTEEPYYSHDLLPYLQGQKSGTQ